MGPLLSFVFAPPKVRHGMRDRRKIPAPGCKWPHLAIDAYVDNGRPAGGNRRFELRSQIGRLLDSLTLGAHGSCHHRVISRKQIPAHIRKAGSDFAIFAEVAALLIPYGAIAEVVPDQPNYWNLVLDGGKHGARVHHESAVSTQRNDGLIRRRKLGAKRAGHGETHRCKAPCLEERARLPGFVLGDEPIVMDANIREHNAVGRHYLSQFGYGALRPNRNRVRGARGQSRRLPSLPPSGDPFEPRTPAAIRVSTPRSEKLLQEEVGVDGDSQLRPEVPANFCRIYVDVNQLARGDIVGKAGKPGTCGAVIESRPQREDDIGVSACRICHVGAIATRWSQAQRMARIEDALAEWRSRHGDAQSLCQHKQFWLGAT